MKYLAIFVLLVASAFAQTVSLAPVAKQIFFGSTGFYTGQPLPGGKIYTYAAGTTTPLATYTDSTGGTPNANPIILDGSGFCCGGGSGLWLTNGASYKFVVQDANGVQQWVMDNIIANNATAANFASPPPLGNVTPNAVYSSSGALNGTLGATTPNTIAATAVTAKSYNTVLEADQYCTTPGTLDQTCFNNVFTACPSTGCAVHLKSGTWTPTAPMVWGSKNVMIFGDGPSVTLIRPAGGYSQDVMAINVGTGTAIRLTIKDISFAPLSMLTAGACLHTENVNLSLAQNIGASACWDAYKIVSSNVFRFDHVQAYSNGNNGFTIDSLAGVPTYSVVFDGSTLAVGNGGNGFLYTASTATSDTEALTFMLGSGALQNTGAGILITNPLGGRISNLWVEGAQFDLDRAGGIVNNSTCGSVNSCGIFIHNSIFFNLGQDSGFAISLGTARESHVTGNQLYGIWGDSIQDNGVYNVISDNLISGASATGAYGIHIQSSAVSSLVQNNRVVNDGSSFNVNGILIDNGATFTYLQNNNFYGLSSGIPYTNNAGANTRDDVDEVFASMGTAANGSFRYCSDCTVATPATCTANLLSSCVCAGGGSGAVAKRLNGAWYCN